MPAPQFSAIVPFFDNLALLELCLAQLAETTRHIQLEIIVVNDNPYRAPPNPTVPAGCTLQVVSTNGNRGYATAVNVGAQTATGRDIILIDSDIAVTSGWLDALVRARKHHASAGAVSATTRCMSTGRLDHFGSAFLEMEVLHPFRGRKVEELQLNDRPFQCISSATLLVDRNLFWKLGGLDETLWNSYADYDFSLRLRELDQRCWVCADATTFHRKRVSGPVRFVGYPDTKTRFFSRWHNVLESDGEPLIMTACDQVQRLWPGSVAKDGYLFANLSTSIYWHTYRRLVAAGLGIDVIAEYSVPDVVKNAGRARLEERLGWDTCRLSTPIIYFVDHHESIGQNHFWFKNRTSDNDLVLDRNANLLPVRHLVCQRQLRHQQR